MSEFWKLVKFWLVIALWVLPVFACTYWIDQDDKRMYKSFMKECKAGNKPDQPRTNVDCNKAYGQAYRETFGR